MQVGLLLVSAGLIGGILGAFLLVRSWDPAFSATPPDDACSTPCAKVLKLEQGHHLVYEQIGRSAVHGPLIPATQVPATITSKDVSVTSRTGHQLNVSEPALTETITRNGVVYGGVVSFHVRAGGRYRVVIDAPATTQVVVAPDLFETLARGLPATGCVLILSAASVSLGLLLLILVRTRRRAATFPRPARDVAEISQSRIGLAPSESRQRWLVWTGLGVIVSLMVAWVIVVPIVVGFLRSAAAIDVTPDLRVGDCLTDLYAGFDDDPPFVDCDKPHRAEVFAKFDLPAVPYPGRDDVPDLAAAACKARFKRFVGRDLDSSVLNQYVVWPRDDWWWKYREVTCIVFAYADVTGTLKSADR